MSKPELLGMESLPGKYLEAILHELPVFGKGCALQDLIAPVIGIIEQRMPDMLHMNADLMRPAGFEPAFDQRNVPQLFQRPVVSDSPFPLGAIGINIHDLPVFRIPRDRGIYGPFALLRDTPDQGLVNPVTGLVEELFSEMAFGLLRFGDHQQA